MKSTFIVLSILISSLSFAKTKSVSCQLENKKSCAKCTTVAAQCGNSSEIVYLSVQAKPLSISFQIFNSKNGTELIKEVPNKGYQVSDFLKSSTEQKKVFAKIFPQLQSYEKIEMTQVTFAEDVTYWKTSERTKGSQTKLSKLVSTQKRGVASEAPVGQAGGVSRALTTAE
jgi:hypothetical protein